MPSDVSADDERCPVCRSWLDDDAKACRKCGLPADAGPEDLEDARIRQSVCRLGRRGQRVPDILR